jgi:RNA polymerase sigma-70 factor, ECF subfamily
MGDDAKLMGLVAGGQNDALTVLIDRWRHRIWTFIDHMCGYLGRTDDIFQDIWMRIYLYRKKYDPTKSFKSYLFAVAVNCCRTNMAKHIPPHCLQIAEPQPPSSQIDPLDAMINSEQQQHVRVAINRLPEKQRTVVLMYLLYDSDYQMIADALELRNGTVRSHMSLALKSLRRSLVRINPETDIENIENIKHIEKLSPEGKVSHE